MVSTIERAFFDSVGLFYQGQELDYPGYQRGRVHVTGVNKEMEILLACKILRPTKPTPIVMDEVRIFDYRGEACTKHRCVQKLDATELQGNFEFETTARLFPQAERVMA